MSSSETPDDRDMDRFVDAADYGRLEEVMKLSSMFSNDAEMLNEALIMSCYGGYLNVVKLLMGLTAADINYNRALSVPRNYNKALSVPRNCNRALTVPGNYNRALSVPRRVSRMWRSGTALTVAACENDQLDIVKYMVEICHADVNLPDSEGYTSLTRTCDNVNMSVSTYFLCEVNDLDVNVADSNGNTTLHFAVWCSKGDDNTQLY